MADVTVKIYKSWGTDDPEREWCNTYEFINADENTLNITAVEFSDLIDPIIAAERAIHLTPVHFIRCVVSTWGVDADENAAENFVSFPLEVTGLRASPSQAIDRNNVLFVRRTTANGRYGKLFYRGCLHEADVESGADLKWRLSSGSSLRTGGADWATYQTEMSRVLIGASNTAGAQMALIRADGLAIERRPVVSLAAAGVKVNKANHKYFDKA